MIKLVASDMDGTFLNNVHEVSTINVEAVKFLKEQNIEFIIATGRAYYEAITPVQEAGINCEFICFNGGITYDINGNIKNIEKLSTKDAYFIKEVFSSFGISYQLYTKKCVYTNSINTDVQAFVDLIESHGIVADKEKIIAESLERKRQGFLVEVENVDLYLNEKDNELIKIIGISNDLDKLSQAFSLLSKNEEISVTSSGINNIEVMSKNATKGLALKKLTKQKNISLENTMVLGDNLNDLSMIEIAGYSVAMLNGNEKIKEKAKFITEKTNDESGVGHFILQNIPIYNGGKND